MLTKSEGFNSSLDDNAEHFHRLYQARMNSGASIPEVMAALNQYGALLQNTGAVLSCPIQQKIGGSPYTIEIELRVYGDHVRNVITLEEDV